MNNLRRKEISKANELIRQAKSILENVLSDEEFAFDNMPENLQNSMRGMNAEEAIDQLNETIDILSEVVLL